MSLCMYVLFCPLVAPKLLPSQILTIWIIVGLGGRIKIIDVLSSFSSTENKNEFPTPKNIKI